MTSIPAPRRHDELVRWIAVAVTVASLLVVASTVPTGRALDALRGWITGLGAWGPTVFALTYALATILMLPGLILTIAAGAIFGLTTGTVTASLGATAGAAAAFLISRHLARGRVAALVETRPRLEAIDQAIGEGGWRIVALLRLSPVVPFNLQNYFYGLTKIRFWPCVLTSWIAMLPGAFMYTYLGYVTGELAVSRDRTVAEWTVLGVGLLATVAAGLYVATLARRRIRVRAAAAPQPAGAVADRPGRRPWGLVAIASLAVVAAVTARLNAGRVSAAVTGLLGPPPVVMTEAFAIVPDGPTFDHSTFDRLLRTHVDADGWIDYEGLRRDVAALDGYLRAVAAAPLDQLDRNERLALLINAYNAYTLKLILENYPVERITGLDRPWKGPRWTVGGNRWTLDQIEHQEIRPKFKEPRIHFALVCAAAGCPPLRAEAYTADRLETQLEEQTRYVHRHGTWARYDAGSNTVFLTKLYDWYGDDFEQASGSVLEYVARYVPAVRERLREGGAPKVRWLDYDWSLNSRANRRPR